MKQIMSKLTWGLEQLTPDETEIGKSWIDSFAWSPTNIYMFDIKGKDVARHQNPEIVSDMQCVEIG